MTKEIVLKNGRIALVDDEDHKEISKYKSLYHNEGYAWRCEYEGSKRIFVLMHHQIMKAKKGEQVDHKDRNKLNNIKSNLRFCTYQQNNANMRVRSRHGYKGIVWDKDRCLWMAHTKVNGKGVYLGRYDTKEEAARAYDAAALEYFGEFARLNFPNERY